MWGNNMSDALNDLAMVTTLNGENIMEIVMSDREDDYVWEWRERISEEIRTRIETGVVTPIKALPWCIRGIGWETLSKEVTF